jgi:hypothetical protein
MNTLDTTSRERRNDSATLLLFVLGLVPVAALLALITDADSSMTRVTAHRNFVVAMRPLAESASVDDMRSWEIRLTSAGGRPVASAQIDIAGPAPQAGQGSATPPRVIEELGGGRYLLEGTRFGTGGVRQITLNIRAGSDADHVTFERTAGTRRGELDRASSS